MNQHILFETMYMTFIDSDWQEEAYVAPAVRVIESLSENSFLASNLEPIVDDGEEHGWD